MKRHLTYNKVTGAMAVAAGLLMLPTMENKIFCIAAIVTGVFSYTGRFGETVTKRWQIFLVAGIAAAFLLMVFVIKPYQRGLGVEERRQMEREMRGGG